MNVLGAETPEIQNNNIHDSEDEHRIILDKYAWSLFKIMVSLLLVTYDIWHYQDTNIPTLHY